MSTVDSWEEFDKVEEWPSLGDAAKQPVKKQPAPSSTSSSGWSQAGLRLAHPYFESQPEVKILTRANKKYVCGVCMKFLTMHLTVMQT